LSNIEIDLDGTAPVTFVGFATTPGGVPACATQNFQGAVVGSADFVRNVTSVATAAFLAGKKVRVSFALGTGACFQVGGTGAFYPKINGLIIQ
jgi:hypothetical protein